jgi:hypothetical protein
MIRNIQLLLSPTFQTFLDILEPRKCRQTFCRWRNNNG